MSGADFSSVGYAEALERARALAPVLHERAARAEEARRLLPETVADLRRTGLLRFAQPKRVGGMELDWVALFDIPEALARGCASTAWTAANLAIHHWMLAQFEPRAQEDVWGSNPDAIIAAGIAYPQGSARRTDGGLVINGTWNFGSGVDGSDWCMFAVTVREGERPVDYRMCIVPAGQYEIVDDWQVLGMRGTGSKTVCVKDLDVPEHRALSMLRARGNPDHPGAAVNPHPHYRIGVAALGTHCIAGVAVGNAAAALDSTLEAVRGRSTNYAAARMRDFQAVQLRVAAAGTRIEAARSLVKSDIFEAQRIAEAGRMPTLEEKLRFKRNVAYAGQLCTEAVDQLHTMSGANGLYDRAPLQRYFRDAHALVGHIGFSWDAQGAPWGQVALGGEYAAPPTL